LDLKDPLVRGDEMVTLALLELRVHQVKLEKKAQLVKEECLDFRDCRV